MTHRHVFRHCCPRGPCYLFLRLRLFCALLVTFLAEPESLLVFRGAVITASQTIPPVFVVRSASPPTSVSSASRSHGRQKNHQCPLIGDPTALYSARVMVRLHFTQSYIPSVVSVVVSPLSAVAAAHVRPSTEGESKCIRSASLQSETFPGEQCGLLRTHASLQKCLSRQRRQRRRVQFGHVSFFPSQGVRFSG